MTSVDVVVPCYQYGRFLRECVTSILQQGISDMRVLIIDNASTDNSMEVARQLASEDSRIEVVAHSTNLGATASCNQGLDWASADYLVLLDADDLLAPGCLDYALAFMESHADISFTFGIEGFLCPDGKVHTFRRAPLAAEWKRLSGIEFVEEFCRTPINRVGAPTVVRRTSAQKTAGHFRPELPYTDDMEMWLRLASVGSVGQLSRLQGIRRLHQSQDSSRYRNALLRDFIEREAAFESFFAHEGRNLLHADRLLDKAKRGLGAHAYWSAISNFCRGRASTAMDLFKFSFSRLPRAAILPPVGLLMRMDQPLTRAAEVLSESIARWKKRHREVGRGGGFTDAS